MKLNATCWVFIVAIICNAGMVIAQTEDEAGKNRENRQQNSRQRAEIPSVIDLVKKFDKNSDGKLTKDEVDDQRFGNNFDRWDADKDGTATVKEISKFRTGLGIPIEGTSAGGNRRSRRGNQPAGDGNNPATFTIPDVDQLTRVDGQTRPSREMARNSAYIIKTQPHAVDGNKYVILTDHNEPGYLNSLERLAKHRNGIIVNVEDLALLYKHVDKMDEVRKQLRDAKVQYIAIAPRMETYRENMLLGMWELISTIDDDPQLDAYPGFLLASNEEKFAGLIDRSIDYRPQTSEELRPFAISQVPSMQELRSLQKSGILRKLFTQETPTVGVYSSGAKDAPKLPGEKFWSYHVKSRGDFLKKFPEGAASEFEKASLLVMHGHGVPGMSCGVDISAIPENTSTKIVMCGSCFAAAPKNSDLPAMRQAPGGYTVEPKDSFVVHAIDSGASVAFGHMRLSAGFPHLFPVLESWTKGQTVGKGYQEMINGIIDQKALKSGEFVITDSASGGRQPKQNVLMYVVVGDPAIQPFEPIGNK